MFWHPGSTFITLLAMNSLAILLKSEGELNVPSYSLLLSAKYECVCLCYNLNHYLTWLLLIHDQ